MPLRRSFAFAGLLLTACSSNVTPTNPYDPDSTDPAPGTVSGFIEAPTLATPEGLRVELNEGPVAIPPALTDDQGAFLFDDVAAGSYRLEVTVTGFARLVIYDLQVPQGGSVELGVLTLVPLTATDDASTIEGTAQLEGADDHGGIRVHVVGRPFEAHTDSTGAFSLLVPEGTHDLVFERADYQTTRVDDVVVGIGEVVMLPSVVYLSADPATITGVVNRRSCAANPAEEVVSSADAATVSLVNTSLSATTDAGGTFTLTGIPAGIYTLRVSLTGYSPEELPGIAIDGGQVLNLSAEPILLLPTRGAVTGDVLLSGTSEHAGSVVQLTGTGFVTLTVADGSFALHDVCAGSGYELRASHDDYITGTVGGITVTAGQTTALSPLTLARQQGGLVLAGGAGFFGGPGLDVPYELSAPAGTTQMRISEDLDLFTNPTRDQEGWESYVKSGTFTLGAAEGTKRVYAQVTDGTTVSAILNGAVVLDLTPPANVVMTIEDGDGFSNDPDGSVLITIEANDLAAPGADAVSGLAWVQFYDRDLQGSAPEPGASEWLAATPISYSRTIDHPLLRPTVEEAKEVWLRVGDAAGNWSAPTSAQVVIDRTEPQAPAVEINGGATFTNRQAVNVTLSATETNPGLLMRIGHDSAFVGALWRGYLDAVEFDLLSGEGERFVWAQFRDAAGNETQAVFDSIEVDLSAPAGSLELADDEDYTNVRNVSVLLTHPVDTVEYALGQGGIACDSPDTTYTPVPSAGSAQTTTSFDLLGNDGNKTVVACLRDRAGNTFDTLDTIVFDQTKPSRPIVILADGAQATDVGTVNVQVFSSDTLTGIDQMRVHLNEACTGGVDEPYQSDFSRDISAGSAASEKRVVCVQTIDGAGNLSMPGGDAIILDQHAPVLSSIVLANNAKYSNTGTVEVLVTATDTGAGVVRDVMVSESPTFSGAVWQPINISPPVVSFILSSGDGTKVVWAKVRDGVGRESDPVSDSIILDTEPPVPLSLVITADNPLARPGYIDSNVFNTTATVYDALADAGELTFRLRGNAQPCPNTAPYGNTFSDCTTPPCTETLSFTANLGAGEGRYFFAICAADGAGNYTPFPTTTTFVYDKTPPENVTGIFTVPGGGQLGVNWLAANDLEPVGGATATAGVYGYVVGYDSAPDFSSVVTYPTPIEATTVSIGNLPNRRAAYVRVRAIDRAGNVSGAWATVGDVPGFQPMRVGPSFIDRSSSHPSFTYANGTLYIVGASRLSPTQIALQLQHCAPSLSDCTQVGNWGRTTLPLNTALEFRGPRVAMIERAGRLYLATALYNTNQDSELIRLWQCPSNSKDCFDSANWTATTIDCDPSTNPCVYARGVAFAQNTTRIQLGYFARDDAVAPEIRPRLASCPDSLSCNGAGDWAVADLGQEAAPISGFELGLTAWDRDVWVTFPSAAAPTQIGVARCDTELFCDELSDFNVDPLGADTSTDAVAGTSLATTDEWLYIATSRWDGSVSPVVNRLSLERCDYVNNFCGPGVAAGWELGTILASTGAEATPVEVQLAYAPDALRLAWWSSADLAIHYAECASPDSRGCLDPADWTFIELPAAATLQTVPAVVTYGSNVALAWQGPDNRMAAVLPTVQSPLRFAAGPGFSSYRASWQPVPTADGYTVSYDYTGGVPGTLLELPSGNIGEAVVSATPGTFDQMAVLAYNRELGVSDPSRRFSLRPFLDARGTSFAIRQTQCNGAPCGRYVATSDAERIYIAYRGNGAGNLRLAHCAHDTVDCTSSDNWTDTAVGLNAPPTDITANNQRVYIVSTPGNDNAVSWCDVTATDCDLDTDFQHYTLHDAGAADPGENDPVAVVGAGRIWVVTRKPNNRLFAHHCNHVNDDCTQAGNWTRTLVVGPQTESRGHSVAVGGTYLSIAYALPDRISYFRCNHTLANNCSLQTDFDTYDIRSRSGPPPPFPDLNPVPHTVQLGNAANRQTVLAVWDEQLWVMHCPFGVGSCGTADSWGATPIAPVTTSTGISIDVAATADAIYAFIVDGDRVRVAHCAEGCGLRASWDMADIFTNVGHLERFGGGNVFWTEVNPQTRFGFAYHPLNQGIRVAWEGRMVKR